MKNLIWSLFAFAFVGMLTLSSCGDGGAAEKAAEKAKMEADSIANAAKEAKMKFEADTNAAIGRLDKQIEEIKTKMGDETAEMTDEAKAEMTEKMEELTKMRDKLKENLKDAMSEAKEEMN